MFRTPTLTPTHPHVPLLIITCNWGLYFDFDLILSNRGRTHQNTHRRTPNLTHTPPSLTIRPWTVLIPSNRGPILNIFLYYLWSPGYNRKPRMSSAGGVSTGWLCVSWSKSSFAGYQCAHTHTHTNRKKQTNKNTHKWCNQAIESEVEHSTFLIFFIAVLTFIIRLARN